MEKLNAIKDFILPILASVGGIGGLSVIIVKLITSITSVKTAVKRGQYEKYIAQTEEKMLTIGSDIRAQVSEELRRNLNSQFEFDVTGFINEIIDKRFTEMEKLLNTVKTANDGENRLLVEIAKQFARSKMLSEDEKLRLAKTISDVECVDLGVPAEKPIVRIEYKKEETNTPAPALKPEDKTAAEFVV